MLRVSSPASHVSVACGYYYLLCTQTADFLGMCCTWGLGQHLVEANSSMQLRWVLVKLPSRDSMIMGLDDIYSTTLHVLYQVRLHMKHCSGLCSTLWKACAYSSKAADYLRSVLWAQGGSYSSLWHGVRWQRARPHRCDDVLVHYDVVILLWH